MVVLWLGGYVCVLVCEGVVCVYGVGDIGVVCAVCVVLALCLCMSRGRCAVVGGVGVCCRCLWRVWRSVLAFALLSWALPKLFAWVWWFRVSYVVVVDV